MSVFDATQLILQAPWAHCFAMTPFPVLFTLRASCLLSLNLLAFALCSEELRPGVFKAMGSGVGNLLTSTCLKGTHPSPSLWTLVKPRNTHHISGNRWWCSTCGTWALRQDSCFSALSTEPHSDGLSQRQKPLQEGCLRCGGLPGVWEPALPNPSFSTPPLISGPRFFLQFEDEVEEVATSQGTGCGKGLDPSQAGWSTGSAGLSPTRNTGRTSVARLTARPGRQAEGRSGPKARPSTKTHKCELCDSAPSSYTWVVKGGWLRKARNRAKSSGEELNQTSPLQLAASWRQGTSHHLCPGCKVWAYEIASAGGNSTQNNATSNGPWAQLAEILTPEPAQAMLPKSSQLLEWIEEHENAFAEGSLEHWVAYRIATCLEEELEDAEAIRTVAAHLQIPKKQTGRRDFCFLVANITTHRREIHTWISQHGSDVFALQETHL